MLPYLAWACLEVGDLVGAECHARDVLRWARRHNHRILLVRGLWVATQVATRMGQWEAAGSMTMEGLAAARAMPYPQVEGRLLQADGQLQVALGALGPARERLESALAIFNRLGARPDAERTGHLLATLG
jgi:hypothetical protein